MTLIGFALALLGAGGWAIWRSARGGGPYRAGPWPGLTPRGAGLLLGGALLLACAQLIFGMPTRPWPDLPILAAVALAPLALATRITQMPGAAAAVCGAYLLPRSLLSLVDPGLPLPPLLLVPAVAFDVGLWLRVSDLRRLSMVWPGRPRAWRKRTRDARRPSPVRAAFAGGLFGLTLAAIEPAFVVLLGADPALWPGSDDVPAAAVCVAACALLGSFAARRD